VLLPSGWNSNADELSRGGAARDNRSRAFNRRFDGNSGGLQDMQPIASFPQPRSAASATPPSSAIPPSICKDTQGGHVKLWSNGVGGGYEQWQKKSPR